VPVRPDKRPADLQASGRAQVRIRGHREHLGGQLLHPVRLPGGQCERRGGQQPPRLIPFAGAELGGALEGTSRGRGAAAPLGLGGRLLEQRGDPLVGISRRGRQMPGVAVGLVTDRVRDPLVRRGALGERNGMVDPCTDQGMGEPWSQPVHPDQARRLRRSQRIGGQSGHDRRGQIWAVDDRREQQRLLS
jgi:hypothetical protein